MFRILEIEELARQKRTLLIQSDRHRKELLNDFQSLHDSTSWVNKVYRVIRGGYPYMVMASPLIAAVTRKKGFGKTLDKVAACTRWAMKLSPLLNFFKTSSTGGR